MEQPDNMHGIDDDGSDTRDALDAFFAAAGSTDAGNLAQAAENVVKREEASIYSTESPAKSATRRIAADATDADIDMEALKDADDLDDKFIPIDPDSIPNLDPADRGLPFVLIPANIHSLVPWWGWVTVAIGLTMMVAGIVLTPMLRLNRLAARLDGSNHVDTQKAMRSLVLEGDEKTVRKLYNMAVSPEIDIEARLRAVDALSLIDSVPEVDRALLRLELTAGDNQVREAAIAARRQRTAYKTRSGQ